MPGWANLIVYAEQFHVQPQDVEATVKLRWWHRWLLWRQASAAKNLHDAWRMTGGKIAHQWGASELALYFWAMLPPDKE